MKESKDFFLYLWVQEDIIKKESYKEIIQLYDINDKKVYTIETSYNLYIGNISYFSYVESFQNLKIYLGNYIIKKKLINNYKFYNMNSNNYFIDNNYINNIFMKPIKEHFSKYYKYNEKNNTNIKFNIINMKKSEFNYFVNNIKNASIKSYT